MKRKKIIIVSISIICALILICSVLLISWFLKNKKNDNGDTNDTISTINLDYITKLAMDITDAKSIGISKDISNTSQDSSVAMNVNNINQNINSKYYLFSTKENSSGKDYFEKIIFKKHSSIKENIYNDKNELIENDVTQDEINAQINKLYIMEDFTFIQFIPIVEQSGTYKFLDENNKTQERLITVRPQNLVYDQNGVSEFDKTNYFSDEFTQSFVISNKTNNIYKIENFVISTIKDGLVKDGSGLIYNITIENNNLKFTTLFNNPNIIVLDYFKDKFGNNYICNKTVNQIDTSTNTIFYTSGYYRTKDNTVVNIKGELVRDVQSSQIEKLKISGVKKIGENLQVLDILDSDVFDFGNQNISNLSNGSWNKLAKIENNIVYLYGGSVSSKVLFTQYDISLSKQTEFLILCDYIYPIDYDTIIYFDNEKNKTGNVYYWTIDFEDTSIWYTNGYHVDYFLNDYNSPHMEIINSKVKLILSNCLWNYNDFSINERDWNNFSIDMVDSRKEYIIVKTNNGNVEAKLISDYNAQANKTVIFQPLKKLF